MAGDAASGRGRDAAAREEIGEVTISPGPLDHLFPAPGLLALVDGVPLHRLHRVPLGGAAALRYTFVKVDPEVRQAIALRAERPFVQSWNGAYFTLWSSSAPRTQTVQLRPGVEEIEVWSKFGGRGSTEHSWRGGHAIHRRELAPGHLRFYCSDDREDGRLDKLVFDLELIQEGGDDAPTPAKPKGVLGRLFGPRRDQ